MMRMQKLGSNIGRLCTRSHPSPAGIHTQVPAPGTPPPPPPPPQAFSSSNDYEEVRRFNEKCLYIFAGTALGYALDVFNFRENFKFLLLGPRAAAKENEN